MYGSQHWIVESIAGWLNDSQDGGAQGLYQCANLRRVQAKIRIESLIFFSNLVELTDESNLDVKAKITHDYQLVQACIKELSHLSDSKSSGKQAFYLLESLTCFLTTAPEAKDNKGVDADDSTASETILESFRLMNDAYDDLLRTNGLQVIEELEF